VPVIADAMRRASVTGDDLTAIAVTQGPGLMGSLLVGVSAAKALALAWNKPVIAVNHLEGHLASAAMGGQPVEYPCLILLVSGGHTLLARSDAPGRHTVLGSTRDDSAGEAYDKLATRLGLGYPGGPVIDKLAKQGHDVLKFPRPMKNDGLDFSFSGLKTAVTNYLRVTEGYNVPDVAASFAAAVMDVLLSKLEAALEHGQWNSVAVVGGVAASPLLRERLAELSERRKIAVCLPPVAMSTDNAAMIAAAAWAQLTMRGVDGLGFGADPRLRLPEHAAKAGR